MIDNRPLLQLDTPPLPAKTRKTKVRRAVPTIPVPPKMPPESWTVQFTAAPGNDAPPICRIRLLLKSAWRRHRLKARIVAGPPAITTPGDSMTDISPDDQRGPQTAFNRTRKNEVVAGMTGRMER